jgi:hypothetical protein
MDELGVESLDWQSAAGRPAESVRGGEVTQGVTWTRALRRGADAETPKEAREPASIEPAVEAQRAAASASVPVACAATFVVVFLALCSLRPR